MSIDSSPKWVQEQVRSGLEINEKVDIKKSIEELSKDTLITFFKKNSDIVFLKNAGPKNSAAHIIAYQKALNIILDISLDTDGVWGEKTRSELAKFQIKQGLKGRNGIPGPETIAALITALSKPTEVKPAPSKPTEVKPAPTKPTEIKAVSNEKIQEIDNYLESRLYTKNKDNSYTKDNFTIKIIDGKAEHSDKPGNIATDPESVSEVVAILMRK